MRFTRHGRLPLLAFAVSAALGAQVSRESFQANDEAELMAALAKASGLHVDAFAWEPSSGAVGDATVGRGILFLASESAEAPREVYRASIRVSYEGKPLELTRLRNLTNTPLGDDHGLVVDGQRAAFATYAFGGEQSVTVLDLEGEPVDETGGGLSDRLMASVTNLQNTGMSRGIGRTDIAFETPAKAVTIRLHDSRMSLELTRESESQPGMVREQLELDLSQPDLAPSGLRVEPQRRLPKRLVFWAVDTVRAVPWIGPAPVAWLEEKVFAAKDQVRRMTHSGSDTRVAEAATLEAALLPPLAFDESKPVWPPADIASQWTEVEAGEGQWVEPKQPWLKRLPDAGGESAPLPFRTTFVRPDEKRAYARVHLVAMDMRQFELGMEAGVEDPKPLTGPPGSGRLPRKPEVYKRVAAAFNGGFKTEHGSYGMMIDKRVLLPPVPGAATVGTLADGRVVMGSWGQDAKLGGLVDIADDALVSFRQNLEPLVVDGVVNPNKRYQWGFTLPETGMQTERSGVCMTAQGNLIYAWGEDLSADTLGRAMRMASCSYGMHLDMNPRHTGYTFININEIKGKDFKSELLLPKMGISPERYISYAPKDFFYLMLRDPAPPALVHGDTELPWQSFSVQPAPKFLPAIHRANTGDAQIWSVAPGRVSYRLRAGSKDTSESSALELAEADAGRVLFALGLGQSSEEHRGLVIAGQRFGETAGGTPSAWLGVDEGGKLGLVGANAGSGDRVEARWLLQGGSAVAGAKAASLAVGFAADGRVLIAQSPRPSSQLGSLLAEAGAVDAVAPASNSRVNVYLAGSDSPLRRRYDDATLSIVAEPMAPRVQRFEAERPYEKPQPKPKK